MESRQPVAVRTRIRRRGARVRGGVVVALRRPSPIATPHRREEGRLSGLRFAKAVGGSKPAGQPNGSREWIPRDLDGSP